MAEDTPELTMRRLKQLSREHNDEALFRVRDRLLRMYSGLSAGRFWDYIAMFDDIAALRRRDGSLQRYAAARALLVDAAKALAEEQEGVPA